MKRTPIAERLLPDYTRGEENANMITHIIGGALGIIVLLLTVLISATRGNAAGIVSSAIYGFSMIALYSVSSVYHGLKACYAKKVMQAVDHSMIYLLIAGTYTPIMLLGMIPEYPVLGWGILVAEWLLAALAAVFTAIDHNKYKRLSMAFYIIMGWLIILAIKPVINVLSTEGMLWIFFGGVAYTVGAVIYGIGKNKRYYHTAFHVFVVIGSLLQAVGIIFYVL